MNNLLAPSIGTHRRRAARIISATLLVLALALAGLHLSPPASAAPAKKPAPAPAAGGMKTYEGRYYIIHTDLSVDDARETEIRMARMAEEYYERTKEFSGKINRKFPFSLFKNPEDYYAAGGMPGSAGVFMGDRLMAIAIDNEGGETWHVVQHEGFHQFAEAVIGGTRPTWVNEGLAEYFGESIWTGDGFVTGVIPAGRMKRIQQGIDGKQYKSIPVMMEMSLRTWNSGLSIHNYDQAWSMTHFLAHGDDGKYQKAFGKFMTALGRNANPGKAWQDSFGGAAEFQKRWEKWWKELPEHPTHDLYAQATVATLTSYLARATAQKQTFDSLDEFMTKAAAGELKASKDDWLPPSLLKRALDAKVKAKKFELEPDPKAPRLALTLENDTRLVGNFMLKGSRIGRVWVDTDDTAKLLADAKKLIEAGKKDDARTLLQSALRKNPKSPLAEEMRTLVLETKK